MGGKPVEFDLSAQIAEIARSGIKNPGFRAATIAHKVVADKEEIVEPLSASRQLSHLIPRNGIPDSRHSGAWPAAWKSWTRCMGGTGRMPAADFVVAIRAGFTRRATHTWIEIFPSWTI